MKHFLHVMFGMSGKVHRFETDPVEQYRFHLFFTWFWFLAMGAIPFVVPHVSTEEKVALAILEISLWANFVSHFTAVGASIAGIYASHRQDVLDGHLVRGFLGRLKRRRATHKQIENPNFQLDPAYFEAMAAPDKIGEFEELPSAPPIGHRG